MGNFTDKLRETINDMAYENEGQYTTLIYELERVVEEIEKTENEYEEDVFITR